MVKLLKFPACKLMRGLPHATYVVRMRLKQLHAQGARTCIPIKEWYLRY
jgi:hypothetical protein